MRSAAILFFLLSLCLPGTAIGASPIVGVYRCDNPYARASSFSRLVITQDGSYRYGGTGTYTLMGRELMFHSGPLQPYTAQWQRTRVRGVRWLEIEFRDSQILGIYVMRCRQRI
jgi:hypothetical protein